VDDLLTTRQLQNLLQLDRVTIYRMLNDGRLPGFKVGGQWRFRRREIEKLLQEQRADLEVAEAPQPESVLTPSAQVLPLGCIQVIQDVLAEALDIAAVTTDLQGQPLTKPSNPCRFCQLIQSSAEGQRRCQASWQALATGSERAPALHRCHAGLLYARGRIAVDNELIATTFGGQFLTGPVEGDGDGPLPRLAALARACGLNEDELRAALPTVHRVEGERTARVIHLLQKAAQTFSEIGQERLSLLNRLRRIAEMTRV
jgi:excisionase family DNA binding protein